MRNRSNVVGCKAFESNSKSQWECLFVHGTTMGLGCGVLLNLIGAATAAFLIRHVS